MHKTTGILTMLLHLAAISLQGQDMLSYPSLLPANITAFDIDDGLPISCANDGLLDDAGRLWIDLCHGLNENRNVSFYQFDGTKSHVPNFRNLPKEIDGTATLQGIDRTGKLYGYFRGTDSFFFLNPDSENYELFSLDRDAELISMYQNENGQFILYAASDSTHLIYGFRQGTVELLFELPGFPWSHNSLWKARQFLLLHQGELWLWESTLTDQRFGDWIFRCNINTRTFQKLNARTFFDNRVSPDGSYSLFAQEDTLYCLDQTGQLLSYDLIRSSLHVTRLFPLLKGEHGRVTPIITSDRSGSTLFTLTGHGINVSSVLKDTNGKYYDYSPVLQNALNASRSGGYLIDIRGVFSRNFLKNIAVFSEGGIVFADIKPSGLIQTCAHDYSTRNMIELEPGRLLIERESNIYQAQSFFVLDSRSQSVLASPFGHSCGHLPKNERTDIIKSPQNQIFYASSSKLIEQDDRRGCTIHELGVVCTRMALLNDTTIVLTANGKLFTYSIFSHRLTPLTDEARNPVIDGSINQLLVARDHSIWIATTKGLLNFDPGTPEITRYSEQNSFNDTHIVCLHEDQQGRIWAGTYGNGLHIFNPGSHTPDIVNTTNGLSNNTVVGILEDNNNVIWVSTFNGITLVSENRTVLTRIFKEDGLATNEFNRFSSLKSSEGQVVFGSPAGVHLIHPGKMHDWLRNQSAPKIYPVSITCYDINTQKDTTYVYGLRNKHILRLPASRRYINVEFGLSSYIYPERNRFAYQVRNNRQKDTSWISLGANNTLNLNNLPAGKSEIHIRGYDYRGMLTENSLVFIISAGEFIYKRFWFYAVIFLFFAGLVLAWTSYKRRLDKADKKRLLELDKIKNRLYTNITHEFRTPLTLIHGPVSLALSTHTPLDETDLKSIHRQSERLQQLITQMLDLQKIEAGKMKPNFIYGDIVTRFHYVISLFESWAKEKDISLEFSTTPQEIMMDYDEEKITQIISNLISNAIKHTPRNGKVSVTVNAPPSSKMLEVRVHDTGTGIGAEDLPFIFDRFYQSPRAAVGGTGIGLSLTKTLVELLGGSIKVDSTVNVGSTFTILLPITANALQTATTNQMGSVLVPHHYDDELKFMAPLESLSDKPIALIIEDHPEVAQFVATCLKKDFATMIASDGDQGIAKAFEHIPDLIVSDVMMPHKDGFEVCATLKKDLQTSHIPVILLTGRGDQASLMQGIQFGADAYVVKPFEPQELLLRANKLLELRKKLSEYYRTYATREQVAEPSESSPMEHEFLRKIRLFVEEHINDPQFNMHMLCQYIAMSHPQLHRKITALTGESTGKFVRSVRLTKAIELLMNSDLTVSEIAYETGFSEPGYFTKVFSKEYSMTPSEYRTRLV